MSDLNESGMSSDRGKLGTFLTEVIHWRWDDFVRAEKDRKYTGLEAAVLSLVRVTSQAKLGAIKLAIDRVDGKIETPVKVEYPKVWFLFPDAESVASTPPEGEVAGALEAGTALALRDQPPADAPEERPPNLATMTLRETLSKMAASPRAVVPVILEKKKEVEGLLRQDLNYEVQNSPLVKSVIAANLLNLAIEKNNFEAITEVFDQIDGKLVETIRVLGEDIYISQYALEAPYGAVKNKDGVYMIEAKEIADAWRRKLESKRD